VRTCRHQREDAVQERLVVCGIIGIDAGSGGEAVLEEEPVLGRPADRHLEIEGRVVASE
jgi:hypothetical protein